MRIRRWKIPSRGTGDSRRRGNANPPVLVRALFNRECVNDVVTSRSARIITITSLAAVYGQKVIRFIVLVVIPPAASGHDY